VTHKSCPLTGTLQKHMPTLTQTATPHTTGPLAFRPASRTWGQFTHSVTVT